MRQQPADLADVTSSPVLSDCDREPIHVPEAIQPHGLLFLVDGQGDVARAAGEVLRLTGVDEGRPGAPISALIGEALADRIRQVGSTSAAYLGRWTAPNGADFDVSAWRDDGFRVVEIEPGSSGGLSAADRLAELDEAATAFDRARTVRDLCDEAALAFRRLTGFDRVMIYRFLEDDSGAVLAEARDEAMPSFLNQHFPAGDIPRQARDLYVRNVVRVIPDVAYAPQALTPAPEGAPLDLSESALRSVSPIHLRYMRNMGVGASASVSIVVEGRLWGLVACHHATPRLMGREVRGAAASLSRAFARQIKSRTDAELLRARNQSRQLEEGVMARLPLDMPVALSLTRVMSQLMQMMDADAVAVVADGRAVCHGACPDQAALVAIAEWVAARPDPRPVTTRSLSALMPGAEAWSATASGLAGFVIPDSGDAVVLWLRAERIETVRWAGDPHEGVRHGPLEALTPRASFDAWSETVRGQSALWSAAQVESLARFRDALSDFASVRSLRRRNTNLLAELAERDSRLAQHDFLLREVNHRVQNSLQLISSFLALQAREHADGPGAQVLGEARRRIKAVSLVHSRLYLADQADSIDLARYLTELVEDIGGSSGDDWRRQFSLDLTPLRIEPERAVTVGLIFTELVINAQKYAYAGAPGPIEVRLDLIDTRFRLQVADQGRGGHNAGKGFGSRMIESMARQLGGDAVYRSTDTGLIVDLTAPARLDSRI